MTTMRQRRQMGMYVGVVIALVIAYLAIGPGVAELINGPSGYVKHPPAGAYLPVDWMALQKGDYKAGKALVPPEVAALDGKLVRVSGFSLPLDNKTESPRQYLAPNPRGCYYCSPPGVSGVVEVDIRGGKSVPLIGDHLYAYGKFKVASSLDDKSLYTLQDAVLMEAP